MSRTIKDKPIKFGGKHNRTVINRKIKNDMKKNRNKLRGLEDRPSLNFINKFLTDRWYFD